MNNIYFYYFKTTLRSKSKSTVFFQMKSECCVKFSID